MKVGLDLIEQGGDRRPQPRDIVPVGVTGQLLLGKAPDPLMSFRFGAETGSQKAVMLAGTVDVSLEETGAANPPARAAFAMEPPRRHGPPAARGGKPSCMPTGGHGGIPDRGGAGPKVIPAVHAGAGHMPEVGEPGEEVTSAEGDVVIFLSGNVSGTRADVGAPPCCSRRWSRPRTGWRFRSPKD